MRLALIALITLVLQLPAAGSNVVTATNTLTVPSPVPAPPIAKVAKVQPLLRKIGRATTWPVRKTALGCKWLGVKTEPYHPFFNLCGAVGSTATPFVNGFRR